MTINGPATSGTEWFLNGISNLGAQLTQVQKELSSGYQVEDAADSPGQTPELINLGSSLAAVQTYQTNLTRVQAEASTADSAIGSAITLIQSAQTIGEEGANSTSSASDRQTLANQIQGIQQQLVSAANTSVEGRYIFGGDRDQTAPYRYNAASPTGVDQVTNSTATRVITGPTGNPVYQGLTAQQIFGPVDGAGNPAANNTFAALQSLVTALNADDTAGIATALTSLDSASAFVNQQQAYYGSSEQTLTSEQNNAANQITALQVQISGIRDTNVTQAATDLTQLSTDQSAAYSAESAISKKSLFDYLA
ncbi:MAG TPA: flagellin [Bryobacteraceae bacterium]|nr:flagellin [Bryobacteraceae bacterium]